MFPDVENLEFTDPDFSVVVNHDPASGMSLQSAVEIIAKEFHQTSEIRIQKLIQEGKIQKVK